MQIFCDSDWTGCLDDRRSTGLLHLCWCQSHSMGVQETKKLSRLSTEFEYKTLTNGVCNNPNSYRNIWDILMYIKTQIIMINTFNHDF